MYRIRILLSATTIALGLALMPQLNTQVQASPIPETFSTCLQHPPTLQPHHSNHELIYAQQCAAETQSMLHSHWYGEMTTAEAMAGIVYEP